MPKSRIAILGIVLGISISQEISAGGFSLYTEGSTSELSVFAAGSAAEAFDASTSWYNPAGLALIHNHEALISGVGVLPSSQVSGTSTFNSTGFDPYVQTFNHLEGAEKAIVPAFHYSLPIGPDTTFGLSIVSPYGLSTNWGDDSAVRYSATLTKMLTVDIAPAIGGRITDYLAAGVAIDLQWAQVEFNRVLGVPTLLQTSNLSPYALDSRSYNKGNAFDVGFHGGILLLFNQDHTRFGLNYQSQISHEFNGTSTLIGPLADPDLTNPDAVFASGALSSNDVSLPGILTLSAYQDITQKLTLLASAVFTNWKQFEVIELEQVAAFSDLNFTPSLVNAGSNENFRNTWRFALGSNYRFTQRLMLRLGFGYDQTPTVDSQRNIRLPDADRLAATTGLHIQARKNIGIDVGYAYLWAIRSATINNTQSLGGDSSYTVNATGNAHAQLIGLQANWLIDT